MILSSCYTYKFFKLFTLLTTCFFKKHVFFSASRKKSLKLKTSQFNNNFSSSYYIKYMSKNVQELNLRFVI